MKNSFQSGSLLQLLRIVSPALPVGAYAGSEGLEYAVEAGWVSNGGRPAGLQIAAGRLRLGCASNANCDLRRSKTPLFLLYRLRRRKRAQTRKFIPVLNGKTPFKGSNWFLG